MDDMDLIYKLVNTAHRHCNVPITAKMRVFDDDDKSLQYAKMLQDAGAQIITVHGRSRAQHFNTMSHAVDKHSQVGYRQCTPLDVWIYSRLLYSRWRRKSWHHDCHRGLPCY